MVADLAFGAFLFHLVELVVMITTQLDLYPSGRDCSVPRWQIVLLFGHKSLAVAGIIIGTSIFNVVTLLVEVDAQVTDLLLQISSDGSSVTRRAAVNNKVTDFEPSAILICSKAV
jgi:hypothetical protein